MYALMSQFKVLLST